MQYLMSGGMPVSTTGQAMQGVFPGGPPPAAQSMYSPQMISDARNAMLAQLGMGLMAAGQPMSGAQRAQMLSQLGSLPAQYQQNLAASLQQQREAQQYQQQQQMQNFLMNASDEQLAAFGITPAQATLYRHTPALLERRLGQETSPVNWQTVQTDEGVFAYNPHDPSQFQRLGGAPAKSPELVNLVPPAGSKEAPKTINVNTREGMAQADELLKQGWTRQSTGTTVQVGSKLNEPQARIVQLYPNIYQSQLELAKDEQALTSTWGNILQRGGTLGNIEQTPEYQRAQRAATDFVQQMAYIRSGANLAPAEAERLSKAYFPQPGDDATVIANKRRARELALKGMKAALGEQGAVLDDMERQINDPYGMGAP